MSTYADIMNKYRGSQTRIENLQLQITQEKQRQKEILGELQVHLTEATGKQVLFVASSTPVAESGRKPRSNTRNPNYRRDEIVARIMELKSANYGYSTIAKQLDKEGYKPFSAEKFSSASVYLLYQSALKETTPDGQNESTEQNEQAAAATMSAAG